MARGIRGQRSCCFIPFVEVNLVGVNSFWRSSGLGCFPEVTMDVGTLTRTRIAALNAFSEGNLLLGYQSELVYQFELILLHQSELIVSLFRGIRSAVMYVAFLAHRPDTDWYKWGSNEGIAISHRQTFQCICTCGNPQRAALTE